MRARTVALIGSTVERNAVEATADVVVVETCVADVAVEPMEGVVVAAVEAGEMDVVVTPAGASRSPEVHPTAANAASATARIAGDSFSTGRWPNTGPNPAH